MSEYRTLGRSGLRVSRLGLGTMTFGQADWGCDRDAAFALMDTYLEGGGNMIDTADFYAAGASEQIVGEFLADRGVREEVVLATKYSLAGKPGDPNGTGNGRKNLIRALDASLRRLGTDYVDLFYLHAWDGHTPIEEVVAAFDDVVAQGKVRYAALSDVPAWYAARARTLAELRSRPHFCGLQLEYSLVDRGIEYEYPSLCAELGIGLVTWSPLGSGVLSGKYGNGGGADGRLAKTAAHTPEELAMLTPAKLAIAATLQEVAEEIGRPPAQVAVNWVASRPAVATVLLGASRPEQLKETMAATEFSIPDELLTRLDEASGPGMEKPYSFLPWIQGLMNRELEDRPRAYLG